jgi:AraC-like DNA-binding protein
MNRALWANERQPPTFAAGAPRPRSTFATAIAEKSVCDTASVDVASWHSLRYWSENLGISETQLVRATRVVGTSVTRIETYLVERRAQRRRKTQVGS